MSKRPTYSEKVESAQQETAHQKRPVEIKRDLLTQTEQDEIEKERFESDFIFRTETYTFLQRDLRTSKETCGHQKRPIYLKRSLLIRPQTCGKKTKISEKRIMHIKRDQYTSKETEIQKKETYEKRWSVHQKTPVQIKRDVPTRPTNWKESTHSNRDGMHANQ